MHAIAWRTFRASQRVQPARQACRIIAGVRRPLPLTRKFHRSAVSSQVPEEPSTGAGNPIITQGKGATNETTSESAEHAGTEGGPEPEAVVTHGEEPPRAGRKRFRTDYGSAANRSTRSKKSTGVPPVILPEWLPKRNIILAGQHGIARVDGKLSKDMSLRCRPLTMPPISNEESESLSKNMEELRLKLNMKLPSFKVGEASLKAINSTEPKIYVKQVDGIQKSRDDRIVVQEKVSDVMEEVAENLTTKSTEDSIEAVDENQIQTRKIPSENLLPLSENAPSTVDENHTIEPMFRYSLPGNQYEEILLTLRASLALEAPKNIEIKDAYKPTTLLLYPKDGGMFFLDSIIEEVTHDLYANLLRLDPQDLAEIVGSYIGENIAWTSDKPTALLGYDTQEVAGRMKETIHEIDEFSEDEDDLDKPRPRPFQPRTAPIFSKMIPGTNTLSGMRKAIHDLELKGMYADVKVPTSSPHVAEVSISGFPYYPIQVSSAGTRATPGTDAWNDLKITTAIEALIDSVSKKRKECFKTLPRDSHTGDTYSSTGLVIQIRDFKELSALTMGKALISKFEEVVKKRWQAGEKILLVGTTSAINQISGFTTDDINMLQSNPLNAKHRTIIVVPSQDGATEELDADERAHTRSVNVRHVEDMVLKLFGAAAEEISLYDMGPIPNKVISDLEGSIWPASKVYRVATLMAGQSGLIRGIKMIPEFVNAVRLIQNNDETRFTWANDVNKLLEEAEEDEIAQKDKSESGTTTNKSTQERIRLLKEKCNYHEKKLLSGVVLPEDIKTSFSDVRSPPETIEALKTLTSLSLIRPEAFSYGVLATDRIPGLLLYGPPGTGKTMLAKAVAKESGATVLDVSGADLSNLYVGEGEKNVKALFSLAKKLTPCVIFIDEADAIFGSRSGNSSRRSSERELINQFLREWDGMNDMSAFIMVATNRPFDLDDAVLRRLPRRLLVDLPTEKDREAILKIHLSNEVLDNSVSLSKLATETPFYSGSDLKNVSVAAALACVREENEEATKHVGPDPYVYPAKRLLSKRHFDKAFEEISASISEDMSTLVAVRKFDEKYGDRKGRRKKRAALGFGGLVEVERDSEAGRVRKAS